MDLTDNLLLKIKAEAGQTDITDSINSIALSSGIGTLTLVNDATYGYIWRLTGGTKSATFTTLGKYFDATARTCTMAVRIRVTSRTSAYTKYAAIGADAATNHIGISNAGTSTGQIRAQVVTGSAGGSTISTNYTTGAVVTLVVRYQETGTTSDLGDLWRKTAGGSVVKETQLTTSISSAARETTYAGFTAATGETLDILEAAFWNRGLTDSEAASVADDITQLWAAAGPTTAISATLANITGSVTSVSAPKTAIAATLANVASSLSSGSGSLVTTIAATLGNVVGAITSTGSTANGTFTSEVLKDYAGNVLANTALNFVRFYNDTTGALVLNKTGVSTNGSGIVTFSDAALVAGTTYRVDWETSAGSRRMPRKAAA